MYIQSNYGVNSILEQNAQNHEALLKDHSKGLCVCSNHFKNHMKIKEKRFVSYQINCIGLFHAISFKNKNVNGFLHTFYMINLVSWFGVGLICLFGVKLLPPLLLWVFKYQPYFKLTNLFLILWSMSPLQCKSFLKCNSAAIGMDNMKNKCPMHTVKVP